VSICGLLGGYLIAFIKTFSYSTVHCFGKLLAFQQLEVELCEIWIVVHNVGYWFKRSSHLSLLWAHELEVILAYTLFRDFIHLIQIFQQWILFSWRFMIFSLSLFSWEEHIVMLSRMTKMNSSKWWGCGC
jgi:hypothetical protein